MNDAFTPGEWAVKHESHGSHVEVDGLTVAWCGNASSYDTTTKVARNNSSKADAELIAMAKEMASAIRHYDFLRGTCEPWAGLDVLAAKLREIEARHV